MKLPSIYTQVFESIVVLEDEKALRSALSVLSLSESGSRECEWSTLVFDCDPSDENDNLNDQSSFIHSAIRTLNLSLVITLLSYGASLKFPIVKNLTPLDLLSILNSDTLSLLRSFTSSDFLLS